ncbi:MAG: hypothetical protein OXU73_01635 [Candidatus Campbellbacteria bacterium]|nr:hypothetical protein [Candidatus Campbellbacteria bacterium]
MDERFYKSREGEDIRVQWKVFRRFIESADQIDFKILEKLNEIVQLADTIEDKETRRKIEGLCVDAKKLANENMARVKLMRKSEVLDKLEALFKGMSPRVIKIIIASAKKDKARQEAIKAAKQKATVDELEKTIPQAPPTGLGKDFLILPGEEEDGTPQAPTTSEGEDKTPQAPPQAPPTGLGEGSLRIPSNRLGDTNPQAQPTGEGKDKTPQAPPQVSPTGEGEETDVGEGSVSPFDVGEAYPSQEDLNKINESKMKFYDLINSEVAKNVSDKMAFFGVEKINMAEPLPALEDMIKQMSEKKINEIVIDSLSPLSFSVLEEMSEKQVEELKATTLSKLYDCQASLLKEKDSEYKNYRLEKIEIMMLDIGAMTTSDKLDDLYASLLKENNKTEKYEASSPNLSKVINDYISNGLPISKQIKENLGGAINRYNEKLERQPEGILSGKSIDGMSVLSKRLEKIYAKAEEKINSIPYQHDKEDLLELGAKIKEIKKLEGMMENDEINYEETVEQLADLNDSKEIIMEKMKLKEDAHFSKQRLAHRSRVLFDYISKLYESDIKTDEEAKEFNKTYINNIKKEKRHNRDLYKKIDANADMIFYNTEGMLGITEIVESLSQETLFLLDQIDNQSYLSKGEELYKQTSIMLSKSIMLHDFLRHIEKVKGIKLSGKIEQVEKIIGDAMIHERQYSTNA